MAHNRSELVSDPIFNTALSTYTDLPIVQKNRQPVFQFTRHATSCFNIKIYRDKGTLGTGGIPSLAADGIEQTIVLAEKNNENTRFKSSTVCVSNLVRTWMTAILLYAFSSPERIVTTITLRICPHLKETGWEGNAAYPLMLSVSTFVDFLKVIKKHNNYKELREIYLLIPATVETPHRDWVKITIKIPMTNALQTTIIHDEPFCRKASILKEISGYENDGDIYKFMEWFRDSLPDETGTIHIVAHSAIMKAYFNKIFEKSFFNRFRSGKFNIEKHVVEGREIDKENCWTFTTPFLATYALPMLTSIRLSIKAGYANPGKDNLKGAQNKEEKKGEDGLCYKPVKGNMCAPTKGGYQTKKNRKKSRRISRCL